MTSGLQTSAEALQREVATACKKLSIDKQVAKVATLQEDTGKSNFWNDAGTAQKTMRELSEIQSRTEPWVSLRDGVNDLVAIINLNDDSLQDELSHQLQIYLSKFEALKKQLAYSGRYDDHAVIMTIYAGAGGTDAQDWAQMLLRMYTRWAESENATIDLLEQSAGDEAGIKSAMLQISVPFAYGKLKGEHGVHRLVRLSPFNADNLRQTSFAKVDIMPKINKPEEVYLDDKDIKVDVFRAGGHGGQSVNTTDSAVRVTHIPTGITVSIQNERSQIQNKDTALTILRSRLAQLQIEQHQDNLNAIKGPNQSAEWGNQIRSYVLHPYRQVKDLRTRHEMTDPHKVLDGGLTPFIEAYTNHVIGKE